MKTLLPGILFVCMILFMGYMLPVDTSAAQYICAIKGGRQDAYVVVTDYDRDGNPMRQRGEKFQGVIKKNQKQEIKSLFGRIRYSYRLYNQSRSSGRNFENCEGGKTIQLP